MLSDTLFEAEDAIRRALIHYTSADFRQSTGVRYDFATVDGVRDVLRKLTRIRLQPGLDLPSGAVPLTTRECNRVEEATYARAEIEAYAKRA